MKPTPGRNYIISPYTDPKETRDFLEEVDPADKDSIGGIKLTSGAALDAPETWADHQAVCKKHDVPFYVGGAVATTAMAEKKLSPLVQELHRAGIDTIEISNPDGMSGKDFLDYAKRIRQDFDKVLIEVGQKNCINRDFAWWMRHMLNAAAVEPDGIVLEGSASDNVGIYYENGRPRTKLVRNFHKLFDDQHLIVEATFPKHQEHWLRNLGVGTNFGNVAINERAVNIVEEARLRIIRETAQKVRRAKWPIIT